MLWQYFLAILLEGDNGERSKFGNEGCDEEGRGCEKKHTKGEGKKGMSKRRGEEGPEEEEEMRVTTMSGSGRGRSGRSGRSGKSGRSNRSSRKILSLVKK